MQEKRCKIIAEIGVNHNGDPDLGLQLIDVAAEAGADAVKFQTFFAEELVTRSARKAAYQVANTGSDDGQFAMLKALELSEADFAAMKAHCRKRGIEFMSTPFSEAAADLLERVGVDCYKVSSGDLTHLPLLRHLARKGKPVILSSGMAVISEVEEAVEAIRGAGNDQISILHCVSNYPAAPEDCNLRAIDTLRAVFALPVGWSDHTMGPAISWAAVARGAEIIEKHITLSQDLPGPDHRASSEPADFADFVAGIRAIERALGSGVKQPSAAERETAKVGRRSIALRRDLAAGAVLRPEDLAILRPGTGLHPRELERVTGRRLKHGLAEGSPLSLADLHD
ncbi:N-acetylneuraminate synthase [Pseudogemmobacter faecipullorum]|uniref:N-acetylneuraminate synthase n=1 Tax=Pseudogemmobacter faecipullorum TaxID=2755041 RepID=A0ABS8CGW7_9RHOB|nr:N-acetylneuraminate synthase [Pseudogemmobacter faecipullorum]MCB5408448.1 N-acetylneuraminate synthase [Pseudogemmobacter faecipullorum]